MYGPRSSAEDALPYPPAALRERVGRFGGNTVDSYEALGRMIYEQLMDAAPEDWDWEGKRVLDFGCGAGRVLRHFLARGDVEVWGCDIDVPSITWLQDAAAGRVKAFHVGNEPGLPLPAGHFDFIYAISIFTHLSEHWAGWLAELHRVLADDGLLVATFLGPDWVPRFIGEERWPEEQVGMAVLREGVPWDEGGPCTIVSEWWLRAHWGRAFEILSLQPSDERTLTQGMAVMRKRPGDISAHELERPAEDLQRELDALTFAYKASLRDVARERAALADARLQLQLAGRKLEFMIRSKSWRLTAPLRAASARARRR